jgi:hypothetical protein
MVGSLQFGTGAFGYFASTVLGANTGTVTILAGSSTISVTSRKVSTTSGLGDNVTTVSPTTPYWITAAESDSAGTSDIDSVTLYIYKTGSTIGTYDAQRSYTYRWVEKHWDVNSGSPSCNTNGGCSLELTGGTGTWATSSFPTLVSVTTPTLGSATTGSWTFEVTLPNIMQYTSGGSTHWNVLVAIANRAYSGGGYGGPAALFTCSAPNCNTRTGTLDTNLWVSITAPSSMSNATSMTAGTNITMGSMVNGITYGSNALSYIQVSATGLTGGDTTNMEDQYGDQIPLSSVTVTQSAACSGTSHCSPSIFLSTSAQNVYSNLAVTASASTSLYWFITAAYIPPGTYTFQYTVTVASSGYPT